MPRLLISQNGLLALLSLCLLAPLGFYLIRDRQKSAASRWLLVLIGGLVLMMVSNLLSEWLYASRLLGERFQPGAGRPIDWEGLFFRLTGFGLVLSTGAFVHFAYAFLDPPFRGEARAVGLVATLIMVVAGVLLTSSYFVRGLMSLTEQLVVPLLVAMLVWSVVVFLRKRRQVLRSAGDPRAAQAYRFYALLVMLPVAFIVTTIFPGLFQYDIYLDGTQQAVLQFLGQISLLLFFFGLFVGYVNYSPEPTTFQAKLVGLVLVAVLGVLAAASFVLFQTGAHWDDTPIEEERTFRFVPDGDGGYRVERVPFTYLRENLGSNLGLGDDTNAGIGLPFAFPFAGRTWDSLYVNANGVVAFGALLNVRGELQSMLGVYNADFFYDPLPKIATYYTDLDPEAGGGVFARTEPGRVVVSWHDVPRYGHPEALNRMQLVLYAGGAFELSYDEVNVPFGQGTYGVRGVVAGDRPPAPNPVSWDDREAGPPVWTPGAGLVEDLDLARRIALHGWGKGLAFLIVGSTLFVLVVFPFFFRTSLARPLERLLAGVKRVDEGQLDAEVEVGVRDEIGYLTERFNAMTASLRSYTGEMESLVAERTAQLEAKNRELAHALDELKKTQARLVQQEKLASLGALTAGIAHEIKNPLNFVNNFAALSRELIDELESEPNPDAVRALLADLRANTEKVEQHGRRVDAIVRSMMQHTQSGKGRRERVDLNLLVSEYVDLARHGKRAQMPGFDAALERDLDEAVGSVEVVPQEIGRVVLNLVGNAFDAVAERAAREGEAYRPTVRVATVRRNGRVEIRVEDNGSGIPEGVRDRIFDPFFTTKPAGQGTGLGLSLSHDIVASGHDGTLTVDATSGAGTVFVVTLPAEETAYGASGPSAGPHTGAGGGEGVAPHA